MVLLIGELAGDSRHAKILYKAAKKVGAMNKQKQYDNNIQYLELNGLNKLFNIQENSNYEKKVFDSVSGDLDIPFPPDIDDLVRLHKLIRQRKCFTVLEFGLGHSTIVMADALEKNQQDWESLQRKPEIRNRFMFQLFSLDASLNWIEKTKKRIPVHLLERVHINQSDVEIGQFNGQLCHFYQNLPDIVADFIYLDGPSPKDVKGSINGLSFQCSERTVMSADLLLMEPVFLPGTFIIIDGRTNNARFLQRNFNRNYDICWDQQNDVTTFELNEPRLGKYNLPGTDFL